MTRPAGSTVLQQVANACILRYALGGVDLHEHSVTGVMSLDVLHRLRSDPRFAEGPLHALHADVGDNRTEFRSWRGAFGPGSLQIVIDTKTGKFYADVDTWNPYADVVNWIGHAFWEVLPGWLRKRKKGSPDVHA